MTNFERLVKDTIGRIHAEEERRKQNVADGISKGCDKCSQWDEYWGCNKCEQLLDK